MDNYHEDMNSGFHAMDAFFIERPEKLELVPAMKRRAAAFHVDYTALSTRIAELEKTKGTTDAKNSAEENMLGYLLRIRSNLKSVLREKNDLVNFAEINLNDTDIREKRDTDLKAFADKVYKLASANAEALAEFNVTAEVLAAFRDAIDDYSKKLGKSIAGPQEKKEMRKAVFTMMNGVRKMLEDMDDTVEAYQGLDMDFYNQYCALRPMKNMGIRHRKPVDDLAEPPKVE